MKKIHTVITSLLLSLTLLLISCGDGDDTGPMLLPERKNAALLRLGVCAEFVDTLLRIKQMPSQFNPTLNAHDYFVDLYVLAFNGHTGAHMAPGFLP